MDGKSSKVGKQIVPQIKISLYDRINIPYRNGNFSPISLSLRNFYAHQYRRRYYNVLFVISNTIFSQFVEDNLLLETIRTFSISFKLSHNKLTGKQLHLHFLHLTWHADCLPQSLIFLLLKYLTVDLTGYNYNKINFNIPPHAHLSSIYLRPHNSAQNTPYWYKASFK